MANDATGKATTRKAQAKKANALMKNTATKKPPATKAKADAKKIAKTVAKTVKPEIKKSVSKRVEKAANKAVLSDAAQKRIEDIKGKANGIILCIKQDVQAAAKGKVNSVQVQKMLKTMMELVVEARKDMYHSSK